MVITVMTACFLILYFDAFQIQFRDSYKREKRTKRLERAGIVRFEGKLPFDFVIEVVLGVAVVVT